MPVKAVLQELKKLGTDQNVKVYQRHGAKPPLFGVSFANLGKLAKKYKGESDLAKKLWKSRNTDARTLAMMIGDPGDFTASEIDVMVKDVDYTLLAGYFGALVGKTKYADSRMKKWTRSRKEFVQDTGFSMLSSRLKLGDEIAKNQIADYLKYIEKHIHTAPNRARHSMNTSLQAIGIYRKDLRKEALAAAKRIGKVEVDHGETSCKTQDAYAYIQKAVNRQK